MAVDKEVVRAFLEDGGAVPDSEGSNGPISDGPLFVGAVVIGMANSSSVIGFGVGNTQVEESPLHCCYQHLCCSLMKEPWLMVDGA